MTGLRKKLSFYAPRFGLASLALCLASGAILSFQYHPFGNVFKDIEEITSVIPFGFFFRRLHYGSGQVFVLMMLAHTADHFLRRRYETYPAAEWARLVLCLALCFFILFTGFILKGDEEGFFAGSILDNILRELPAVGDSLAGFFIIPGETGYWRPFLHHCIFLPVLVVFLLKDHVRAWLPDLEILLLSATGLFADALLVRMPLDIPPHAEVATVHGPWFFLGIQELLRLAPPLWAGLFLPAAFLALVLSLPLMPRRLAVACRGLVLLATILYAALSVTAVAGS